MMEDKPNRKKVAYTPISDRLIEKFGLSLAFAMTYVVRIWKFAKDQSQLTYDDYAWISKAVLAKKMGCSKQTAQRLIDKLNGDLKIIKLMPRKGTTSLFTICKRKLPAELSWLLKIDAKKLPNEINEEALNPYQNDMGLGVGHEKTPNEINGETANPYQNDKGTHIKKIPLNREKKKEKKGDALAASPSLEGKVFFDSPEKEKTNSLGGGPSIEDPPAPARRIVPPSDARQVVMAILTRYQKRFGWDGISEKLIQGFLGTIVTNFPKHDPKEIGDRMIQTAIDLNENKIVGGSLDKLGESPHLIYSKLVVTELKKKLAEEAEERDSTESMYARAPVDENGNPMSWAEQQERELWRKEFGDMPFRPGSLD